MGSVVTRIAKIKMVQARKGENPLPTICGIAIGNGAEENGILKNPLEADIALRNELMRKEYVLCEKVTDTCYRYRIELGEEELAGEVINEAALYDSEGDLLCISSFSGKPKDSNMEMAFEFDDTF